MQQNLVQEQVHCPKCNSTEITAQKHGFSAGKAVAGAVLTGGVGLLAGLHGSSDIDITCLSCGNKWNPKDLNEKQLKDQRMKEFADLKKWKAAFYSAYEGKDIQGAASIYNSKFQFSSAIPDVHAAYKAQKRGDKQLVMVAVVAIAIVGIVIYFLTRMIA